MRQIKSAYSGKDGYCCCGCAGTHYTRGVSRNDDRQVTRIANIVLNPTHAKRRRDQGVCSVLVDNKRIYIVYYGDDTK